MIFDIRQYGFWLSVIALLLSGATTLSAQSREAEFSDWPESTRIRGRIIVSNGLTDLSGLERLSSRIFESKTVVVIQGDKVASPWRTKLMDAVGTEGQIFYLPDAKALSDAFPDARPGSSIQLSDRESAEAANSDQGKLDVRKIQSADVVIVEDGGVSDLELVRYFLQSLLAKSGTLILEGSSGSIAGKYSMKSVGVDLLSDGLGVVPDSIITFNDNKAGGIGDKERRVCQLAAADGKLVALFLDTDTAFMLSGRKMTCFGSGKVTAVVPESEVTPRYRQQISEFKSRRQSPEDYLIDLTQWRRLAMERELPQFPPEKPPVPKVENGTLLIVGGGGSPRGLMNRFVELAGGIDHAKLVYIPCAEEDEVSTRQSMVAMWKRMGIKHATFIHTKDRNKADSDDDFLAPLKDATGLFFGGGRQWNFSDSYYGTKAHRLMKDVLKRGGVIAGSSAGASIQARYLARSTPIGNFDIMAPGYERGGLGFIGGVAIDQHFSQRGRQKDMVQLMKTHPQLLGIGLDEATAIEVQKSTAKVTGNGRVFFYDATVSGSASSQSADAATSAVALPAGSVYDLAKRIVVLDASSASDADAASPENDEPVPKLQP